jgi:hypothetical protein
MTDQNVAEAIAHCASMFGLSPETVVTIVQVGLPQMARMAEHYPELLTRMHAASLAPMPESLPDFYVRMSQDRALRQAIMDDYKATYGAMLETVNRAAARAAGTTDGQARDVLAAVLPAITQVMGRANTAGGLQAFLQQLMALQQHP